MINKIKQVPVQCHDFLLQTIGAHIFKLPPPPLFCLCYCTTLNCYSKFRIVSTTSLSILNLQEIDPKVENDDFANEGMEGFLSELTNAIPGVDEAMSFAEMLK